MGEDAESFQVDWMAHGGQLLNRVDGSGASSCGKKNQNEEGEHDGEDDAESGHGLSKNSDKASFQAGISGPCAIRGPGTPGSFRGTKRYTSQIRMAMKSAST